jgi:ribosomal protein S11
MTIREGEIIPFEEKLIKIGSVLERFRTRVANRLLSKKRSRHPMLIVNTAKNNIFLTVTDYVGRVLTRVSGGSISYMGSKFEGKKRSTAHATYQSTAALIRWFAKKKIKKIQLFFKCRRDYHTREVIRALENLSSEVYLKVSQVHIRFRYPFSHGPRPKRKRYV